MYNELLLMLEGAGIKCLKTICQEA
jgi:hypothetical protein